MIFSEICFRRLAGKQIWVCVQISAAEDPHETWAGVRSFLHTHRILSGQVPLGFCVDAGDVVDFLPKGLVRGVGDGAAILEFTVVSTCEHDGI